MGEFDIKYLPQPSIKVQELEDFILEYTILKEPELNLEEPRSKSRTEEVKECWVLNVDGSSNITRSGAELVLTSLEG